MENNNNATSFNGIAVYRVKEIAECQHVRIKKNILTKKTKTKVTPLLIDYSVYIVATNKDSAIKKYKKRYKSWEVGDKITVWKDYDRFENCEVIDTSFELTTNNMSLEELYEKLSTEDFIKYVTFLNMGFNEILKHVITYKE